MIVFMVKFPELKAVKFFQAKNGFFFEGEKFTEMKSEENIELEERDSVLFYIDKNRKWCFVNNIEEYDGVVHYLNLTLISGLF